MSEEKPLGDVVDDLVEIWHTIPANWQPSLEQFLGFTENEYGRWAMGAVVPAQSEQYLRWMHSQLFPTHEVFCPSCDATIRARMADAPPSGQPTDWDIQVTCTYSPGPVIVEIRDGRGERVSTAPIAVKVLDELTAERAARRIAELESQVADLGEKLKAARRQHRSDVVAQQEAEHGRWAL